MQHFSHGFECTIERLHSQGYARAAFFLRIVMAGGGERRMRGSADYGNWETRSVVLVNFRGIMKENQLQNTVQ